MPGTLWPHQRRIRPTPQVWTAACHQHILAKGPAIWNVLAGGETVLAGDAGDRALAAVPGERRDYCIGGAGGPPCLAGHQQSPGRRGLAQPVFRGPV